MSQTAVTATGAIGAAIPLATLGWLAGGLAALAVLAYVLKMRRRRFEVPFSTLWQRVLREKEATTLWKHLKRLLSLALQLAILGLLLGAVLDPQLGGENRDTRSVVIIMDASASMKAVDEGDGTESRIAVAKRKVRAILDGMGGGDTAMIMRMDGQTTPLSRFDSDAAMLGKVVDGLAASDTPADLPRALGAAADALRERPNPLIILVGDGAYPEQELGAVSWEPQAAAAATAAPPATASGEPDSGDEIAARRKSFEAKRLAAVDLSGIDVRYVPVGKRSDNVGIVAFNARRKVANKMSYDIYVEVQNFGKEAAQRKLVLYDGDTAIDVKPMALQPGERVRQLYRDLSGGSDHRMRAVIEAAPGAGASGADPFDLDDTAYALLPVRKKQTVYLVTRDNLYLEGAMLVYDSIEAFKLLPEEYEAALATGKVDGRAVDLGKADAIVFDDYTPAALPQAPVNLIYFNPSGPGSPFPIAGSLQKPRITEVNADQPVMRWVGLSDVNFVAASSFRIEPGKDEIWLARSVRDTLIACKRDGGRKIVAFGFGLGSTDLTLRVAFPLLLVNSLDWFAGDDADLITTYQTGHPFHVPLDATFGVSEAEVSVPGGRHARAPVVDGRATFYGSTIGIHRLSVRADGRVAATIELAANLANPTESDIAPSTELNLGGRKLEAPVAFAASHRQSIWVYLVLAAMALLGIEWITYHRRVTV